MKTETLSVDKSTRHLSAYAAPVPVLSFFSGAGFLDTGFLLSGFDIIWHNEYDASFVRGFEFGMSSLMGSGEHCKIQNTYSIVEIGPNQIAREAFHNMPRPSTFGIIGGPPCPDFSIGGKNRGKEGDRGKLSQVYVHRIIELQPTFFLFENVPGLIRTQRHRAFLIELLDQLSKDYLVDLRILNALDFGIPQDRERIFIVGFQKRWLRKNNIGSSLISPNNAHMLSTYISNDSIAYATSTEKSWFPWPEDARYMGAKLRFDWPDRSPFGASPEKPENIPNELMVGPLITDCSDIYDLPNGLDSFVAYSDKFLVIDEGDVSRKSFKRLHRWRYSPAAAYGNNEVHLHPNKPRRLTVREALRIQSVPDAYALPPDMTLSSKFKTIGNGVPVKLAQAVSMSIAKVLGGELHGRF